MAYEDLLKSVEESAREKELELPPGKTVGALLATIGIDRSRPAIVARNGWMITPDEEIRAGDRIVVSPIFSGG